MTVEHVLLLLVLGAATAAASVTMARTHVFAFYRDWVESKSEFFGHLASCHYCTGHWVALAAVATCAPWEGPFLFVANWMAVTAVAGAASWLIVGKQ